MYSQLTEPERYTLGAMHSAGHSQREIAAVLGRCHTTIGRELRRNRCFRTDDAYRPTKAQERTNGRRSRSRRVKQHDATTYEAIDGLLRDEQWSPEQIARWLAHHRIASISHMTIYRHVRADTRAGGTLRQMLRHGTKKKVKRKPGLECRGRLQGKPMIDTRPAVIEQRLEPGHWEGDTVIGSVHERDCLLTLVERSSGFALVQRLPHRTVTAVNRAAIALIRDSGLPFKSITWDNGTEFHGYKALEEATGVRSYFAYPHRPWQRGSNENFNGLLRQYFPKRQSLARIKQHHCDEIATKINHRPRKRYGYQSPYQRLDQLLGVVHLEC